MMTCVAQARRRALTHAYLLSYDRFERVASPMTPFAAGGSALLAPRAPLVAGVPAAKASAAHRRSAQRPCRPSLAPRAAPDSASDVTSAFSTEPGGWSSSFEKRDEKKPGSSGAPGSDAVCLPVAPEEVADLPLTSECGADYTLLRDLLASCEWEKADDETRLKMTQLAGEDSEAREWVYFSEVKNIPAADLLTIDALWKGYSRGRYGFSVQRSLWLAEKRRWGPFFTRIGWTTGENKAYRKFPGEFLWTADAPKGHLPLTNCLRGTQLFSALLEHPAFGGPLEPLGVRAGAGGAVSFGGSLARGGTPPLEDLQPAQRMGVIVAGVAMVLLGLLNQH